MAHYHLKEYDNHLKKCDCGGKAQMILDPVNDYVVRCGLCHNATDAYMNVKEAMKAWENGECTGEYNLLTDELEKHFAEIKTVYIGKDHFSRITAQSADFESAIVDTGEQLINIEHRQYLTDGCIEFERVSDFEMNYYKYKVDLSGKNFKLERIQYHENGSVDAIKYKCDDEFLFVFSDEFNLIITMSKSDLLTDDTVYETEATLEIEEITP